MKPGIEADDVIASLADKFINTSPKNKVFIASSDSDFFQLISNKVKIVQLKSKGNHLILDKGYIVSTFGVEPADYIELKSLVGDKADNIKGIPGIGWKRGLEIMIGKRKRPLGVKEHQLLELNRQLIRLNRELEVGCPISSVSHLIEKSNKDIFEVIDA